MTVTIKLHPLQARDTSVVVGDIGDVQNVSLFYPVEDESTITSGHRGLKQKSLRSSSGKLIITHRIQTYNNEASWSTSVKEQLAELAYRNIVIVGQTAADKGPGTGDSIAESGDYAQLTDAGASFASSDVGRLIILSGAPTAANDGNFLISSVTSGTVLIYLNTNRVAEAAPALSWTISGDEALTPTQIRAL